MNRRGEKWLARYFLLDESVPLDEVEIYLYGVRLLIKKLCHIIFIILLGFFFGEFFSIAIFLITYAHIREYSGGYHADSTIRCYGCTIVVTLCAIGLVKILSQISWQWGLFSLLIGGSIIWKLSPQEAVNKPLSEREKRKYQDITHKYLLVSGGISGLGFVNPLIMYSISTAWMIQAIMLIMGKFKSTRGYRKRI